VEHGEDYGPQGSTELTFAEKLDRLFKTMHPVNRGEFTYREVEAGVRQILAERADAGGAPPDGSLSASYICNLRRGRRANPTLNQVELLAQFFKVPVTYFVGTPSEVASIDGQMALVRVMRHEGVRDIALRASDLNDAGLRTLDGVIASLLALPGMRRGRTRTRRSGTAAAAGPGEEGGDDA